MRRLADYLLTAALFAALAFLVSRLDRANIVRPEGVAVVNDGDTITVGGRRIRLKGIDAPEYRQTCRLGGASYPCGQVSRQTLAELVRGRAVTCEGWERDKYERLLAVCRTANVELNRQLVEDGWAVAYGDYAEAETAAKLGRKGMWAGDFDRPRAWREMHGALIEAEHGLVQATFNWLRQVVGW